MVLKMSSNQRSILDVKRYGQSKIKSTEESRPRGQLDPVAVIVGGMLQSVESVGQKSEIQTEKEEAQGAQESFGKAATGRKDKVGNGERHRGGVCSVFGFS